MLIPQALLEADTLTRLIEDFVTREGTYQIAPPSLTPPKALQIRAN